MKKKNHSIKLGYETTKKKPYVNTVAYLSNSRQQKGHSRLSGRFKNQEAPATSSDLEDGTYSRLARRKGSNNMIAAPNDRAVEV